MPEVAIKHNLQATTDLSMQLIWLGALSKQNVLKYVASATQWLFKSVHECRHGELRIPIRKRNKTHLRCVYELSLLSVQSHQVMKKLTRKAGSCETQRFKVLPAIFQDIKSPEQRSNDCIFHGTLACQVRRKPLFLHK